MAVNSKAKGNSVERELCKILEKLIGGSFTRSFHSGAFTGGKNAYRKDFLSKNQTRSFKADITPPDNMSKLIIECKGYKALPFHHFLTSSGANLFNGWTKEIEFDCDNDDIGFICFKINRKGWYIGFKQELNKHKFKLNNYVICNDYIVTEMKDFIKDNKDMIIKISE